MIRAHGPLFLPVEYITSALRMQRVRPPYPLLFVRASMQVRLGFGWIRSFSHSRVSRRVGGEYQDYLNRSRRDSRKARERRLAKALQDAEEAAAPPDKPYAVEYNPLQGDRPRGFMHRQADTEPEMPPPPREPRPIHDHPLTLPSDASGGVPDPTPEYLELASQPPLLLPQPRGLLVVVDLNGTLLHRPGRNPTRFVERPFARSFLSYIVNTFKVVIWSSARRHNVTSMCRQLLPPPDHAKLVTIWDRSRFGLSATDYDLRVLCFKRLTALWSDPLVAASHPDGERWSQLNTVLVDDTIEKARTEPFNLIQVPPFNLDAKETDIVLPQVHEYLNQCSQQANVSAYIKDRPFQVQPGFRL